MHWLRRFDWESRLRRIEAAGAGLGLLLIVLTLTPPAATALGPWLWLALIVGLLLLIGNTVALLWRPVQTLAIWLWGKSPLDIRIARKTSNRAMPDKTERGFLDYELDFMGAAAKVSQVTGNITSETKSQTRRTVAAGKRLTRALGASVQKRHRVVTGIAKEIESFARRLEGLEREYRAACDQVTANGRGLVKTSPASNDFSTFGQAVSNLRVSMVAYRDATSGTRDTMQQAREINISQDANRAYEHVIGVLDKLIEDAHGMVLYCDEVQKLVAARKRSQSPGPRRPPVGPSASSRAGFRS